MELRLFTEFWRKSDYVYPANVFEVSRALIPEDQWFRDSVLKLDYKYTPWPRHKGNLLWQ